MPLEPPSITNTHLTDVAVAGAVVDFLQLLVHTSTSKAMDNNFFIISVLLRLNCR